MNGPSLYELTIEERHLDSFGHVNNALYLEILEEARWDLITRNGYGRERVRETGFGPVILELSVKFKKELRLGDEITIETRPKPYRKRIGTIEQRILNKKGVVCTEARFVVALFDLKRRSITEPTPEWLRAIGF